MALHKQVDFAALCGVSKGYLSVNKKRGKVILSGDYVDDSIEPNVSFLKKCLEKKREDLSGDIETQEPKPDVPNVSKPVQQFKSPNVKKPNKADVDRFDLTNAKKSLEIENLQIDNAILVEKLNKIQGITIPKEPTLLAFNSAFRTFTHQFKNAMDKHITRWSKHFTAEELALAKKEIIKDINQAQHNAIEESKKSIAEIVAVSSIKKEVGERE